jgi:acyl-CoA thioesterase-2
MTTQLDDLVTLLGLERLEENLFRGQSQELGWGAVFGGQVLGQALSAATQTVAKERLVHSMHAYFLWPGDPAKPIIYDVDRIRDGASFTTRRVVAIQAGRPIFNLSASFQIEDEGFEHQDPMPDVPPPEALITDAERVKRLKDKLPEGIGARVASGGAFEMRSTDPEWTDPLSPPPRPGRRQVWIKSLGPLPDDPQLHRELLAYISDWGFISASLQPHGRSTISPGMQIASIDHVMWFHAPFRIDDWVLHVVDSPVARNTRGLVRGQMYTRDGRLIASTTQEGLIRKRRPKPATAPST